MDSSSGTFSFVTSSNITKLGSLRARSISAAVREAFRSRATGKRASKAPNRSLAYFPGSSHGRRCKLLQARSVSALQNSFLAALELLQRESCPAHSGPALCVTARLSFWFCCSGHGKHCAHLQDFASTMRRDLGLWTLKQQCGNTDLRPRPSNFRHQHALL